MNSETTPQPEAPSYTSRLKRLIVVVFLFSVCLLAYLAFTRVRRAVTALLPSSQATPVISGEQPLTPQPQFSISDLNKPLQPENRPQPQSWDGSSRVNLLLLGLDYRDWVSDNGPSRSDTMILATFDPETRTGGLLSIPRDLWVEIPNLGYHKINQAYQLGEVNQTPGGGPGLAITTVEKLLDVSIPYYAEIDFNAFVRFVDEIGGVKLDVPERIVIDPLGDNNTKTLKPGVQTLPGDLALAYARTRNTSGSDFDRSQRQQQVIMAIRNRILDFDLLPTLISKAPVLYQEIASGIQTNLTLQQIIQLAWVVNQIPEERIKNLTIGPNQVSFSTSLDGQDILLPMPDGIRLLRDEIFTASGPLAPTTPQETDSPEILEDEKALLSVRNGTLTAGLAAVTAEFLVSEGMTVTEVTNADQFYEFTTIIDYSGKPYTIEHLVELMGISPSRIYHRHDPNSEVDVVVILGEDWALDNPIPKR
ncbi:MAG: LCP family protein [Anaerolineales bacterium]|jgi:LCP family protein required for cell wall assembly